MAKKTVRSTKVTTRVSSSSGVKKNTAMAALAYVLFFIPLLTDAKNDSYVKFHVKQSLVLLIVSIGWSIASQFLRYLPVLGWVVGGLAGTVVSILLLILWVKGLMNALNGKEEVLPVVGSYASQFKF
ncbi:MAG: hypothetical protein HZA34_03215 [Candidatus Pacebacteria bacterium]|nr:hypothetical protein [Candidatus Paceibacterota bacterium]